jgi:Zyg-11 protein homolog
LSVSNELQLLASLKYYKNRQNYIQKSLYHLFELSKNFKRTRVDLIELIIQLMRIHSKSQSVQLAATTCIFNLTRQDLHKNIPDTVLSQIVNVIINSMQIYPSTAIVCLFYACSLFGLFFGLIDFQSLSCKKTVYLF